MHIPKLNPVTQRFAVAWTFTKTASRRIKRSIGSLPTWAKNKLAGINYHDMQFFIGTIMGVVTATLIALSVLFINAIFIMALGQASTILAMTWAALSAFAIATWIFNLGKMMYLHFYLTLEQRRVVKEYEDNPGLLEQDIFDFTNLVTGRVPQEYFGGTSAI